jgi:hypothetical protein
VNDHPVLQQSVVGDQQAVRKVFGHEGARGANGMEEELFLIDEEDEAASAFVQQLRQRHARIATAEDQHDRTGAGWARGGLAHA